mgnify:FL=1
MRIRKLLAVGLAVSLLTASIPFLILHADSGYTRMEAETYALTNWYNQSPESWSGASGNAVIGGSNEYRPSFNDLSKFMDKSNNPFVQYEVEAPEDGKYTIVVGMVVGFGGSSSLYSAVQVNGKDVYKAEVDNSENVNLAICASKPLEVTLKKGHNIIRCTGLTSEQSDNVGGWINHDYLDIDSRLTPLNAKDTVTVEAENTIYYKYSVSENVDDASNRKVLGDCEQGHPQWDRTSIEDLSVEYVMSRVPGFVITVDVPSDGYYDMTVYFRSPNTSSMQVGMIVDGTVYTKPFKRASDAWSFKKNRIEALTYFTAGEHIITFTMPLPKTRKEIDNNSWAWADIDCVVLGNGLKLSDTQKKPEGSYYYNRLPANVYTDSYFLPDREAWCGGGTSDSKGVGGAHGAWADLSNPDNFMNKSLNSFVEYTVVAPEDGEYQIRVGFQVGNLNNYTPLGEGIYSAVQVNGTGPIYKAKFQESYGNSYGAPLTVSLKKGRNIIRCSCMLEEHTTQKDGWWINHHYLDIPKNLTGVAPSSVVFEAEDSEFLNRISVRDGEFGASGKMLGNAGLASLKATSMTFEKINMETLSLIPYFSITVNAPEDGYYSIDVLVVGDVSNLYSSQIALIVDGAIYPARYTVPTLNFENNRIDATTYLTKGEHVITFTTPILRDDNDEPKDYGVRWLNFDRVILRGGLTVAETQKPPTDSKGMIRYSAYDYALANLLKHVNDNNGGPRLGYGEYSEVQKTADILANGINPKVTPFAEFVLEAPAEGNYLMLLGINLGVTGNMSMDKATTVIEVNEKMYTATQDITKPWQSSALAVYAHLKEGRNVLRVTYFTGDSVKDDGSVWMDFVYLEVPASLNVMPLSGILEAENSEYNQYGIVADNAASGSRKIGGGNYRSITIQKITYDTLTDDNLSIVSWVKYSVFAEEAGTYSIGVSFFTGNDFDTGEFDEAYFAMIVNGKQKKKVTFYPFKWGRVSTIVTVDLEKGENTILFTCPLSEFQRITDEASGTMKYTWVDHDCIVLPNGVQAIKYDNEGIGDDEADVDDEQLEVKPSDNKGSENNQNNPKTGVPVNAIPLSAAAAVAIYGVWATCKRRKVKI